jgi:hypothetical protein
MRYTMSMDKTALSQQTKNFIMAVKAYGGWPKGRPWTPQEVKGFVQNKLGGTFKEKTLSDLRPAPAGWPVESKFRPGDEGFIDADAKRLQKPAFKEVVAELRPYDGKRGVITGFKMLGSKPGAFNNLLEVQVKNPPAGSKGTMWVPLAAWKVIPWIVNVQDIIKGKPDIEVIYLRDPNAKIRDEQKEIVQNYMNKGKPGEPERDMNYYSGAFFSAGVSSRFGGPYITMLPQQRSGKDDKKMPEGFEHLKGYEPRSLSLTKGTFLYIGLRGQGPKDWKKILEMAADQMGIKKSSVQPGSLRERLIRLAYENPELRNDILPILTEGKE